jgi:hypothetical protein
MDRPLRDRVEHERLEEPEGSLGEDDIDGRADLDELAAKVGGLVGGDPA